MGKLLPIVLSVVGIVFIYFAGQFMSAERECFSSVASALNEYEVKYQASNVSRENYCTQTYALIDSLDACLVKADSVLPPNMQFIKKVVTDFETVSQYRPKSLQVMKDSHDEVCVAYPDYLFVLPQ